MKSIQNFLNQNKVKQTTSMSIHIHTQTLIGSYTHTLANTYSLETDIQVETYIQRHKHDIDNAFSFRHHCRIMIYLNFFLICFYLIYLLNYYYSLYSTISTIFFLPNPFVCFYYYSYHKYH